VGLPLGDNLRLEAAVAVAWNRDLDHQGDPAA
jgi:hypothetical protein